MTYFTQDQKDEVRRRISLAQKRRWERLSPEARQEIKGRISGRISNANKGRKRSQEHKLAQSKTRAKYHFRVTKLDTKEILLEDCTRKEVDDSEFAANYYQTNGFSLIKHLKARFEGANITGSIILNVSGVNYCIERYLRNK